MTAILARPAPRHRLTRESSPGRILLRAGRRIRRGRIARAAAAVVGTGTLTTALVLPALCLAGMALLVVGAGR